MNSAAWEWYRTDLPAVIRCYYLVMQFVIRDGLGTWS